MAKTEAELIAFLWDFIQNDPMKSEIVDSSEAMEAAVERHKAEGRRLASVSNTGLKPPLRRLTFLPNSAFTDNKEST